MIDKNKLIDATVKRLCPIMGYDFNELMSLEKDDYTTTQIYYVAEAALIALCKELPEPQRRTKTERSVSTNCTYITETGGGSYMYAQLRELGEGLDGECKLCNGTGLQNGVNCCICQIITSPVDKDK